MEHILGGGRSSTSLLGSGAQPIDLGTALRLVGVQNPDILLVRQQVLEAVAIRQLAAAQLLPSINYGSSYDTHAGNLQQSSGNILLTNRSSVYVGAGSLAVAAGTVAIPGVVLAGNVGEGLFRYLATRQVVRQREFATAAITNQTFLRVCHSYNELLRAEGRRAIAEQTRNQAAELARITAEYARTGEGRQADADRAASTGRAERAGPARERGVDSRRAAGRAALTTPTPSRPAPAAPMNAPPPSASTASTSITTSTASHNDPVPPRLTDLSRARRKSLEAMNTYERIERQLMDSLANPVAGRPIASRFLNICGPWPKPIAMRSRAGSTSIARSGN